MHLSQTIAVVVPCHNEHTQITRVLETMPDFVDRIYVVDDKSTDATVQTVRQYVETHGESASRIRLIEHAANQGVGKAIVTGYKQALNDGMEVVAVMAGDGQMDPDELASVIEPVTSNQADYAKGNRLFYRDAWNIIPRHRFLGNAFLSMLTKIASGYWHSADSQTGYTAISRQALELIDLDAVYPRYGYPNDMLVRLNLYSMRVVDVPIRPVYNVGESSGIRLWKVIPTMSWLIFKRFCWRLVHKYIIHDFHPLIFFYMLGAPCFLLGLGLGGYLAIHRLTAGPVATTSTLLGALLIVSGLQLILFAMWFDLEANRDLCVRPARRRSKPPASESSADPSH